ncbi:MAG TPA: prolyl oligopeptidase family serine peptidase [Labilithrix sp.]|nr:prolyl oligopeptidase family serine peptidase [Labilithrix sp.]
MKHGSSSIASRSIGVWSDARSSPRRARASCWAVALSILSGCVATSCADPPHPVIPPVTMAMPKATIQEMASDKGARLVTRKSDVVDTLHGVKVPDPYRWLEDGDSAEVRSWTETQNAHTRKLLEAIPGRDVLKAEVTELLQVGYVSAPAVRASTSGVRYFHVKREGAQNQPTLYVRDGHAGKDKVLIDVAALSDDGTTALDWWYPSWDGSLVAWGKSESGSEDSVLHIRDVVTGKDLSDRIDRTRHASVAWLPDGKSFYYSRYPAPGTVPSGEERYHARIYLHVIGQDPQTDKLIFGEGRDKTDVPQVMISPNGRWLVVRVHMGWDKSEVYLRDLAASGRRADGRVEPWTEVAVKTAALFDPNPRNDRLYIQTNEGAPRYKLFAVDYAKPERAAWTTVLPESKDVLHDVAVLKNEIVVTYMHDASSRVERYTLDGKARGPVVLPGIGSASISGLHDGEEVFVDFTSYVVPHQVHRVDLRQGARLEPWDRVGAKFVAGGQHDQGGGASGIEVNQIFATSKDGARVPMFVVSKKGMKRDGNNPTVLYGYGGFNVNQTPAFSPRALASVQRGAVWVTAILRGGGEFGEEWHQAGMLEKKQNTFDDLFACAETLFKEKITNPERLGVIGGSNGGLLVAAAITQHPEMFRVGLSLVPLTDMVRYHRFRIAKLWIPEYGDPEKSEHFKFLFAYSPYHHAENGKKYPSLLFTTAESDTRVDPMHARKMAARMQEAQGDPERPVLIRVETKAGHGAGKPVTKLADELADELSFLLRELGVTPPAPQ